MLELDKGKAIVLSVSQSPEFAGRFGWQNLDFR
jgi:hypothetical protein